MHDNSEGVYKIACKRSSKANVEEVYKTIGVKQPKNLVCCNNRGCNTRQTKGDNAFTMVYLLYTVGFPLPKFSPVNEIVPSIPPFSFPNGCVLSLSHSLSLPLSLCDTDAKSLSLSLSLSLSCITMGSDESHYRPMFH